MTTICIVRHGETDWNAQKRFQGREDIELNENGKEQASVAANYLKKSEWDVIISSPLKRASMTAEIIGKHLGLSEVITSDAFIERDFGKASGMTLEQQKIGFTDGIIPGKESDDVLSDRATGGLELLVKEYDGKNIILVSHGAVINSLLKAISNNSINIGETLIKNACVNIIKYIDNNWHIELYNSVDYLTSKINLEEEMPVNIAKSHYLGKEGYKRMNCAQSVICAFRNEFKISEDIIETFKAFGGGKAPDGMCGAYYAAKYILQKNVEEEKICELENYFLEHAGAVKCHEIREGKKLSCIGCVEKSSEFLGRHLG